MALGRHTRQLIKLELQAKHMELCHEYRKCRTKADADLVVVSIKPWWFSMSKLSIASGVCSESALKELTS